VWQSLTGSDSRLRMPLQRQIGSGDRIAIASYLGNGDSFDRAIADFSEAYADQNESDFASLQEAVRTGRCASQTDL
jgi:hypothetical protein